MTIHIIGVGALGSNLAHMLVRLGFENLILYDFDDIVPHNLTNQIYKNSQVGLPKVHALKQNLLDINPNLANTIIVEEQGYHEQHLTGAVFLCLDSIELRHKITKQNRLNRSIEYFCDMRIGLEEGQMYAITPSIKNFDQILASMEFKDSEIRVPRNACGSTLNLLPTIQMIVSLGVTNFIKFLKSEEFKYFIIIDAVEAQAQSYKF